MKEHQQVYKRRIIRERVMQALYAFELSKDPIAHVIETIFAELREHEEEFSFAQTLLHLTIEHQPAIDAIIKKKAANWNFDRIALIDKLLLRMGICELYLTARISLRKLRSTKPSRSQNISARRRADSSSTGFSIQCFMT